MNEPTNVAITNNEATRKAEAAMQQVVQGCGYLVMWGGRSFQLTSAELQQRATDAGLPVSIVDNITSHTITAAIGLSLVDTRWKREKHNDHKIEAKVLHIDQNGTTTIEFLGYDKDGTDGSAKGKRTHLDKVVLDGQGNWMHRGANDFADTFISIVDHHVTFLGGNDIYEKVTRPILTELRSFRIARNNYYVRQNSQNSQLLDGWEKFFASIGYELVVLTQAIDERTKSGLSSRASQDLQSRLEDVHNKIKGWKDKNRVHGRSQETVITRLGEIMSDAESIEAALGGDLQTLRDAIISAKKEALGIINTQAPSGVAPALFAQIKGMLTDDKIMSTTDSGNVYLFQMAEFAQFMKGDRLTSQADRATAALGYYSFSQRGLVVLRPRAELTA